MLFLWKGSQAREGRNEPDLLGTITLLLLCYSPKAQPQRQKEARPFLNIRLDRDASKKHRCSPWVRCADVSTDISSYTWT